MCHGCDVPIVVPDLCLASGALTGGNRNNVAQPLSPANANDREKCRDLLRQNGISPLLRRRATRGMFAEQAVG
jgi:hypothetical protein